MFGRDHDSQIHLQPLQFPQNPVQAIPLGHIRLNDNNLPIHFGLIMAFFAGLFDFRELIGPSSEEDDVGSGSSEEMGGGGAYTG